MDTSFKPLFPAYPSTFPTEESKKEWLSNTSFTDSALKQASEFINAQSVAPSSLIEERQRKKKEVRRKRKRHDKSSDPSAFVVPISDSVLCKLKKGTFIEQTGLSYERAFQTDARRDTENLMFECFEKTKAAKYHLCLKFPAGLSKEKVSNWSSTNQSKVFERYFSKRFLKLLKKMNSISVTKEVSLTNQCFEYIPVNFPLPSTVEKDFNVDRKEETREKIIFYNKSLSDDSRNISLWLEFVDFQDTIVAETGMQTKKHVIEKKLAILEKALKYNPKDIDLNIRKLTLCQSFYNTEKLTTMWNNLLSFNVGNALVWRSYLLFFISNLSTFNCSNVQRLYTKCLKSLSNSSDVQNMLGIFHQLCSILRSCGYPERGIATYQALVEFNLFSDPKVFSFEPFWDSGAPRVGERDAIGWAETVLQKKITLEEQIPTELNKLEDEILSKKLPLPKTWFEFEKLRETHHWLPCRAQTSDGIDDDRYVSFDCVSSLLFPIPDEHNRFLLVTNFISFLGFNMHSCGCHTDFISIDDSIWKEVKLLNNPLCFDACIWTEERFNIINNIFLQVCSKFSETYQMLMYRLWIKFQIFFVSEIKDKNKDDLKKLRKFARGILQQPQNRNSLLLWAEYLRIEWLTDSTNAVKTFRTLLQSSVSAGYINDILYLVQQFIDLSPVFGISGNVSFEEVRWVLFSVSQQLNFVPFSNQEINPTMILKTVSALKNIVIKTIDDASSVELFLCHCLDPSLYSVVSCVKCLAHFQYFSKNYHAALESYKSATSLVEDSHMEPFLKSCIKEELCVAEAELLNYHTWHSSSTSMRPLRKFLCESVQNYPTNTKLLSLLLKLKNASALINPTRRLLSEVLQKKPNPVTLLFALTAELTLCQSLFPQQSETLGSSHGINWRIRALYERMLQSDVCGHNPLLWRSYLRFEMMIMHNVEKAENVFHRALQNCGWSKDLLMDGIDYFPNQFKQIISLMEEKQIRLHTPIEEATLLMEHAV